MKEKSPIQKHIESILVDAGEVCPDDYQSGFDWKLYNQAIEEVLEIVGNLENYPAVAQPG